MQYEDILGQKEIKKQLQQTIAENRVSHAQLFLGPEGSGALPMALAYATEILCTNTNKNKQASFLKCQKLAHPDLHLVFPTNTTTAVKKNAIYKAFQAEFREAVFENPYLSLNQWLDHLGIGNKQGSINVASSQEIIRDISLKPFESDYKVVIFWMVEKLHPSASNKLLKILEEPPAKTTFILIAENPELLLQTIISRTQIVKFNKLHKEDIKKGLSEKFNLKDEELNAVVALSDGNFLEAIRHVESGGSLAFNRDSFISWMRLAFKRDIPGLIKWVEKIGPIGREHQKGFLAFSLHIFRESLIKNTGVFELTQMEGVEDKFVTNFAPFVNGTTAHEFIKEFSEAHYYIERNANPRILFMDLSIKVMILIKSARKVIAA